MSLVDNHTASHYPPGLSSAPIPIRRWVVGRWAGADLAVQVCVGQSAEDGQLTDRVSLLVENEIAISTRRPTGSAPATVLAGLVLRRKRSPVARPGLVYEDAPDLDVQTLGLGA